MISKDILQKANIGIDDVLDVSISDGMIMLIKPFRHKTLEERAAEFGGKLDLDGEFDWGDAGRKRGVEMKEFVHQGDILKVENIKSPVLVTSKDFFN